MCKLVKLFLLLLLVISCTKEPEPKPTTPLLIKTSNGDARFAVEVANTPDDLQQGLMHRSTLAFNSGMIFNIYPVRPTAMWMKNTKIPLDMIFVAPDGTVSMIKENAQPMSEDLIISRDPVRAVIELNAGQVRRNQIKVGDKVTHMLLNGILDTKAPLEQNAPTARAAAPKADIPIPTLDIKPKADAPAAVAAKPVNVETPAVSDTPSAPVKPTAPVAAPAPQAVAPQPKLPVPAPTL